MFKPHTIAQFRILEFLRNNFVLEDCLIIPISRDGLMLEDCQRERIAFLCRDDLIQETAIPVSAEEREVHLFRQRLLLAYPEPAEQTFEAKTKLWIDFPGHMLFQQALGLPDELFRHYLRYPLPDADAVRRLVERGMVSEEEYRSVLLWYLNGNTDRNHLCAVSVDGVGICMELVFGYRQPGSERLQFYCEGCEEMPLDLRLEYKNLDGN